MNDENLLNSGTKIICYRNKENDLLFFSHENDVFCKNVKGLPLKMNLAEYFSTDWKLFIYSSKLSFKCVLLYNGNIYGSIVQSTKMKEEYNNTAFVIENIKFHEHQWVFCVNFKMVNFHLG